MLIKGEIYTGLQQYFKVLDVYNGEVTIYVYAGDCHRVERGSQEDIELLIKMSLAVNCDDADAHRESDDYLAMEHPEIQTVVLFKGDCEYDEWSDEYKINDSTSIDPETGDIWEAIF